MGARCCHHDTNESVITQRYRRVLIMALVINFVMFLVEIVSGLIAGSVSLQADALDFFADSVNYVISLYVVASALRVRATAAMLKGLSMLVFGLWVMGATIWNAVNGSIPDVATMGVVGLAALIANVVVLMLLWSYREGDSNMRSVWLCSRNDVLSNMAILLAALGVFGTGTGWPDIIVAGIMSSLALQSGWVIVKQGNHERRVATDCA